MLRFRKRLWLLAGMSMVLMLFFGASTGFAATAKAEGAAWKFHDIVDAAFVQQYAKVPQPAGVMIIDSRPYKAKYSKGHIPTAVSIPHSQFDKMVDKLPKDKGTLLIYYCQGPT